MQRNASVVKIEIQNGNDPNFASLTNSKTYKDFALFHSYIKKIFVNEFQRAILHRHLRHIKARKCAKY